MLKLRLGSLSVCVTFPEFRYRRTVGAIYSERLYKIGLSRPHHAQFITLSLAVIVILLATVTTAAAIAALYDSSSSTPHRLSIEK